MARVRQGMAQLSQRMPPDEAEQSMSEPQAYTQKRYPIQFTKIISKMLTSLWRIGFPDTLPLRMQVSTTIMKNSMETLQKTRDLVTALVGIDSKK